MGGSTLVFTGDQILRIKNAQKKDVKTEFSPKPKIQPSNTKQITGYKNPGVACILSLILFPGIGQFYNEQPGKGVGHIIAGAVGLSMYVDGSKEITTYDSRSGYTTEQKNKNDAAIGAVLFLSFWIYSGVDAYNSAKEINKSLTLSVTPNRVALRYKF